MSGAWAWGLQPGLVWAFSLQVGGGISSNCAWWAVLAPGHPWPVAPGDLRLPLGHIPHEIGGSPAFDIGVLGGQS